MRKILYSFLILLSAFVLAQDLNPDTMMLDRMPTDAEIRQIINKYDFDEAQKEYLFKETKRKLQMMYSQKSTMTQMMKTQNSDYAPSENGTESSASSSSYSNNSSAQNSANQKRKLNSHDPLTRRSK